jgi:hypothetical protein
VGKTVIEIEFTHFEGEMFTFFFTETEDDDGIVVLEHDHFDDFVDIGGGCS